MNREQWGILRKVARGEVFDAPPVALIVDSPWIPGHLGLSTLDYMTVPEVWLAANLQVEHEFPEVIFLPGFWAEIGMCAEPSAFGCKVSLYSSKTPVAHPMLKGIEELDRLAAPDPRTDGLMPVILSLYRRLEPRVNEAGHVIKMVAARGPLTVATHLMGATNFLLGLKLEGAATHRLLRLTTTLVRQWLEAQAEALREVEGVLVLDDIAGFLSPQDYLEFAHPYLKEIFGAFPGVLRMFHNDTDNPVSYRHLSDLGIDVFNFTHLQSLARVRELAGPAITLMGNVPPLEILTQGTPGQVQQAAQDCVRAHGGARRLLLSAGGGVPPGAPAANLRALAQFSSRQRAN
jgi:uroporphyrinogen-III decarboxylase